MTLIGKEEPEEKMLVRGEYGKNKERQNSASKTRKKGEVKRGYKLNLTTLDEKEEKKMIVAYRNEVKKGKERRYM